MEPFLEKYFRQVDEWIGDPTTSRRLTRVIKYDDLATVERTIWERLMRATGQESLWGRDEYTFNIEAGKEFYPLPGNFRQFISCQRHDPDDRNVVLDRLSSKPHWSKDRGIVVLTGQNGFQLTPIPEEDGESAWTLVYLKGSVRLHYATAGHVGEQSLTLGTPASASATFAGQRIDLPNYLTTATVRICDADRGVGQIREVVSQDATTGTCLIRHAWDPIPNGTVQYEIRPAMPPECDEIYAIAAAMKYVGRRAQADRWKILKANYAELWDACLGYVISNVADRTPQRMPPADEFIDDIYLQESIW